MNIQIKINNEDIKLTPDEAKRIWQELNEVFGSKNDNGIKAIIQIIDPMPPVDVVSKLRVMPTKKDTDVLYNQ